MGSALAWFDRLAIHYCGRPFYLERQRRKAQANNEGYGTDLQNEPETPDNINLPNPIIAIAPLILVGVFNLLFTRWIPVWYGATHELTLPVWRNLLSPRWVKLTPSGRWKRPCAQAF
jgi:H+/gluconate symporter-like permease